MKKRGMLQQQVFYYILAAVMISLIFMFGYQQLVKLQNLNEQAKFVTFKNDFQNAIQNIYNKNPGSTLIYSDSSQNKPLILPKDAKKICFRNEKDKALVKSDSTYFTSFYIDNLFSEN